MIKQNRPAAWMPGQTGNAENETQDASYDEVYNEEAREALLENDELEAFEEAFMKGWDEAY